MADLHSHGRRARHAANYQDDSTHISKNAEFDQAAFDDMHRHQAYTETNSGLGAPYGYADPYVDTSQYRREHYAGRKRSGAGKVIRRVIAVAIGAIALYAVLLGVSAYSMYGSADGVRGEVRALKSQLLDGDYASARQTATSLTSRASELDNKASNPLWTIASVLPFVGNDIDTVRALCSSANTLCSRVLVPAVDKLEDANVGAIVGEKHINPDAVKVVLEAIADASGDIALKNGELKQLETCRIGQVESVRKQLRGAVGALDKLALEAPTLASRIHWLLGAEDGPRTYLVVAQNNVEIRATGGYPGSLGPLYVDNGAMEIGDFVPVASIGRFDSYNLDRMIYAEPMGVTAEEQTIFGTRMQLVPGDANYCPSFPRAAYMWEYTWEITGRGNIDGVIAIDPVLIQSLLGILGPMSTLDGTVVDGKNAATVLMRDIYWTRTGDEQDAFFAEVAKLLFGHLFDDLSGLDVLELTKTLWHAGQERRLSVAFDDVESQEAFAQLGYSGELGHDAAKPVLGVYFNDDTWSKMFWYFSADTTTKRAASNPDGSVSYHAVTTVRNNISAEEAANLPDYVGGHSYRCRTKSDMVAWVYLVAPEGGSITDVSVQGSFCDPAGLKLPYYGSALNQGINEASYEGLDVWFCMPQMDVGEQTVIEYTVTTAPSTDGMDQERLRIDTTPTAQAVAGW